MSQMATAIDNLRARLDGDPDLIALAKIFIPAYTRVKDGQTQNVDAHFREGRPGEKVMLKDRTNNVDLGEVVIQNDGSLYHTETGTTLADVPDGHDLVEMPKSVDEALEAGETPDLDELVDDAQRVDVEAPESAGDVYEGTEDFLSQPFVDGSEVGPERAHNTMAKYYGGWDATESYERWESRHDRFSASLRMGKSVINDPLAKRMAEELDADLDKAPETPTGTNLVTYRGVARSQDGWSQINKILDADDPLGMELRDGAYPSTALTRERAAQYSKGDAVLRYRIPEGSQHGGYIGEDFVLKRDETWVVARVEDDESGLKMIDLVPREVARAQEIADLDARHSVGFSPDDPDFERVRQVGMNTWRSSFGGSVMIGNGEDGAPPMHDTIPYKQMHDAIRKTAERSGPLEVHTRNGSYNATMVRVSDEMPDVGEVRDIPLAAVGRDAVDVEGFERLDGLVESGKKREVYWQFENAPVAMFDDGNEGIITGRFEVVAHSDLHKGPNEGWNNPDARKTVTLRYVGPSEEPYKTAPDVAALLESAGEALLDDDYPTANLHMNSARDRMAADLRAEADFLSGIEFDSVDVPDPNPDGPEPSYPEGSDDPEDFEEYAYELRDWLRNEADWDNDLDREWEDEVMWAADVAQNEIGPDVVEAVAKVRNLLARARGEDVPFDPNVSSDVERGKEEITEFMSDPLVSGSVSDQFELRTLRSRLGDYDPSVSKQAYEDFQKMTAQARERDRTQARQRAERMKAIDAAYPRPTYESGGETDVEDLGRYISDLYDSGPMREWMDSAYDGWPPDQGRRSVTPGTYTAAEAVEHYTGFSYIDINGELRGDPPPEGQETVPADRIPVLIRALDEALAVAPPAPEKLTAYRGLKTTSHAGQAIVAAIASGDLEGSVIMDRAYMSASMKAEVGSKFAFTGTDTGIVLRHHVPKGSRLGAWARPVSRHDTEEEFLLGRGQQWRVEKVTPFHEDSLSTGDQTSYTNQYVIDLVPVAAEEGVVPREFTVAQPTAQGDDQVYPFSAPQYPEPRESAPDDVDTSTGKMSPPEDGRGLTIDGEEFEVWQVENKYRQKPTRT